jgi:hypothetical protein
MTKPSRHAAVVVSASSALRDEAQRCADDAGVQLHCTTSIPDARRMAMHAPIVIIGVDQVRWLRAPIRCANGPLVLAADYPDDPAFLQHTGAGANFCLLLPTGREWLVQHLSGQPAATAEDGGNP